ncbi:MAG: cbb3-type cytochrome c oxidase subunit 3 [Sphingomicrobium sp.]
MSYEALRHFADSYALAIMAVLYLVLTGWALRPSRRAANDRAAKMIFDESEHDG